MPESDSEPLASVATTSGDSAIVPTSYGAVMPRRFAALLIVEFAPGQLIAVFGAANESVHYTRFAVKAFRIYLCMLPLATLNKGTFIFLQAMGRALESTALSMVREVVFGVGFALLLPRFFQLDGVLYSMPVSDVLTFAISVALILRTWAALSAGTAVDRRLADPV